MSVHKFGMKKILVTTTLTIALTACGGDSVEQHLSKASSYLAENNQNAAIIELKNAIKKSESNPEARILLGKIYLERGNYLAAEKELKRALQATPFNETAVPLLARTHLNLSQYEKVTELTNTYRITDNSIAAEVLSIQALAFFRNGQQDEAKEALKQAEQAGIDNIYSGIVSASITAANDQIVEAIDIVNMLSKSAPNNTDVWLLLGHLKLSIGEHREAADAYLKAVQLAPDALQHTLLLARALVLDKRYEAAAPYIDAILARAPGHPLSNQLKAQIEYSNQNFESAYQYANTALQSGSRDITTNFIAAVSAYNIQKYEQALPLFERLNTKIPEHPVAQKLLVATYFKLGELDQAVGLLNELNPNEQENSVFLSNVGKQLTHLGRLDEALELAEKAAINGNIQQQIRVGLIKVKQGDASGIKNLESALENSPNNSQAMLGIVWHYINNGDYEQAHTLLDQWLLNSPNDQPALLFKGSVLQQQGEYKQALEYYQKVLTAQPNDQAAKLSIATVFGQQKEYSKAYEIVKLLKQDYPENHTYLSYLITYALPIDKLGDIDALLLEQLSENPNSSSLIGQRAELQVTQKLYPEAIANLESIPVQQRIDRNWLFLGDLYTQQQQVDKAKSTYLLWLEQAPLSKDAYLRNIKVMQQAGQNKEALKLTSKAIDLFPQHVQLAFIKSNLEYNLEDFLSSQITLDGIAEPYRSSPLALTQQALIYQKQNNWPKAIESYEKLNKLQPTLHSILGLAQSYRQNNQTDKAIQILSDSMEQYTQAGGTLELRLAELRIEDDPSSATKDYLSVLEREPNNIVALNNLAWVYLQQNKPKKALEFAQKAYDIAPNVSAIADTLGYSLLKVGKQNEAAELLAKTFATTPEAEIGLHYAESLIALKNYDSAKAVLETIKAVKQQDIELKTKLEEQLK